MLKPIQVLSRVHLSEQSSSEDDDDVSLAVSSAHLTGPFCVVLSFLYDAIVGVETFSAVTGIISSSNSSGRNIGTNFMYIFQCSAYFPTNDKTQGWKSPNVIRFRAKIQQICRKCSGPFVVWFSFVVVNPPIIALLGPQIDDDFQILLTSKHWISSFRWPPTTMLEKKESTWAKCNVLSCTRMITLSGHNYRTWQRDVFIWVHIFSRAVWLIQA